MTRARPRIDQIAFPWLIKRFIDTKVAFISVPFQLVIGKAAELNAIPFDIPNVLFTHHGVLSTFDALVK